jgi:hypothetical protein
MEAKSMHGAIEFGFYGYIGDKSARFWQSTEWSLGTYEPRYDPGLRPALWPSLSVTDDGFAREVSLPLWLLAAVCLVWPVTSLLLARRRKGRRFAVEPAADAAPPAIDPSPHHPSNLPPP